VSCSVGVGSRFLVLGSLVLVGPGSRFALVGAGVAVPVVHIDSGLRLLVWSWDHLVVSFTVTSIVVDGVDKAVCGHLSFVMTIK
jgi:hypothetical protein